MLSQFQKRKIRVRSKLRKSGKKNRLSVFISNKHIYVQLIDDVNSKTIVSTSTKSLKLVGANKKNAKLLGDQIGDLAKKHSVDSFVFDRGGYLYHGVIKVLADAVREKGLNF